MGDLAWMMLGLALVLSGDALWTAYRDWRARRLLMRYGRTITAKFLPPPL